MTIAVLQLTAISTLLKADVSAFKLVSGAADLENALSGRVRALPACFIVPLKEDAGANTSGTMVITQDIVDRFAVVYAVKDLADPLGVAAIDGSLRDLRLATLNALVGWVPASGFDVCEYDGGSLIRIESGTIFWRDRFRTSHINEI